ncbi:hypothetical protein, partial [Gemmiger formicilis]
MVKIQRLFAKTNLKIPVCASVRRERRPDGLPPTKRCSLAKGLHLFVMPIFLSTGASNGRKISRRVLRSLGADTLVIAVRGAALLSGQVGY